MNNNFKILVVDDEIAFCEALSLALRAENYDVSICTDPQNVMEQLNQEHFDLILSDLKMPELNGVELLKEVKNIYPEIYFIILTAFGTIENAVEAMKYGAFSYVIKGSEIEKLLNEIRKITKITKDNRVANSSESNLANYILASSNDKYIQILEMAEKAARSDSSILILGESGVGKEVIAQYIYENSKRNKNKFIATNCHTYAGNLLESELFGHEKGAFTGALQRRTGLFETAKNGTLFLDEIGDIPLETQAKLLRAIETKKINRIGSNDEIQVNFRLITATNKNLEEGITKGTFREDLFFRISTIILHVPALRNRKEDLPRMIDFFAKKTCASLGLPYMQIPENIKKRLTQYDFPGNVRELKNIIERLIVLSDDGQIRENLLSEMFRDTSDTNWQDLLHRHFSLKEIRREIESRYIADVLKNTSYDMPKAAEILGISKRHLFNKIAEYDLGTDIKDAEK